MLQSLLLVLTFSKNSPAAFSVALAHSHTYTAAPRTATSHASGSGVHMKLGEQTALNRRAAVHCLSAAALGRALGANAARPTLVDDMAKLQQQQKVVESVDSSLKSKSETILASQLELKQLQAEVVAAMARGDDNKVKALEQQVKELQMRLTAEEAKEAVLQAEEGKEVKVEKTIERVVEKDKEVEVETENKELFQAEEGIIKQTVGPEIFDWIKKFLPVPW